MASHLSIPPWTPGHLSIEPANPLATRLSGQRSIMCRTTRGRRPSWISHVGKPTVGGELDTHSASMPLNQLGPQTEADRAKVV